MKKAKLSLTALFLVMAIWLCIPVHAASTPAGTTSSEYKVKKGLVKEGKKYCWYDKKGKRLTNTWKTTNGSTYYFDEKGYSYRYSHKIDGKVYVFGLDSKLVLPKKPSFVTVGKYTYYVDTKGCASTGWFTIGNKLYRANSNGQVYKNRTVGGITLGKNRYATNSTATRLKLKTMSIVSQLTNSSMSKSAKLRACWNYMTSRGRFQYTTYGDVSSDTWYRDVALYMLETGRGDCKGFACAFAALAREIGYNPIIVRGRVSGTRDGAADGLTRHAWVKINGLYYDPEAQWAGWYRGVYGLSYYNIRHVVLRTYSFVF